MARLTPSQHARALERLRQDSVLTMAEAAAIVRREDARGDYDDRDPRTSESFFADYRDPLDELDRDGGSLEDADEDSMDRWARAYDDLNGAPEDESDR